MTKREKVGKISSDLLKKQTDPIPVVEQTEENLTEYEKELFICVANGIQRYQGDFYVVVSTKLEPLMKNVLRNYFIHRKTCPTPDYDQILYKYSAEIQSIDFLWVIPSKDTCNFLLDHVLEVAPEERQLLQFVLDFSDGTLMKIAKQLNREKADSPNVAIIKTDKEDK
jgi:hypothetical protein